MYGSPPVVYVDLPRQAWSGLLAAWHDEVSGAVEHLYSALLQYAYVTRPRASAWRPCRAVRHRVRRAIVDETGQIGVDNALDPLVRDRRAVLVDDHQQLQLFLDSEVDA